MLSCGVLRLSGLLLCSSQDFYLRGEPYFEALIAGSGTLARECAVGLQEAIRDEYSFLLSMACFMVIFSEMRLLMRPVRGRMLMSFSSRERVDMLILPALIYCSEWVPMPKLLRPLLEH